MKVNDFEGVVAGVKNLWDNFDEYSVSELAEHFVKLAFTIDNTNIEFSNALSVLAGSFIFTKVKENGTKPIRNHEYLASKL